MKKVLIVCIASYLIIMHLVYSGVFRNMTNPLNVTKYYFECLQNRESFLTYPICKSEFFKDDRKGEIYSKYQMGLISRVNLRLLEINNNYSIVQTELVYKNSGARKVIARLEKNRNLWLMTDLE